MEFDSNKPIWLQIGDAICDGVLAGSVSSGQRLPSVREYGAQLGVNPNTVMRTYEKLTQDGIIFNKRGIGYFVSDDAKETIVQAQRKNFMDNELPAFVRRMRLLGINPAEIDFNI
ncbi:MAG: GntR family transcriptional regulator [Bacteroidales bacterium]|nr:GntR family transcriptional regulator [Bacteroidales bacterium]